MGGFNINLPGLNFNLTPEAIDAARAAQGLPPLNAAPAPVAPPVAAPAPPPPMAAPAPVPDVQPSIGQGVGSFLLNERFGQNIPVEPRIPAQPAPVAAPPPPPPVAAAPPPPPPAAPPPQVAPPPQAMPQPRDMLGSMALSAPSERFEPVQADLPVQPAPTPAPVAAPPPPPPPPPPVMPMADSEGVSINIQPPVVVPPPPPPAPAPVAPPPPVVAPPPPPPVVEPAPPPPVERTAAPIPVAPVTDQGIGALTAAGIGATQYQGLEGFDPANPLNPVAAPAPAAPAPMAEPESGSQVFNMDDPYLASTGGPPIGYQGGGGEYNPQDGYTDEDRIAADEWYASQRRAAQEEEPAPEPPPPPPPVEAPPPDYTEVPDDTVVIVPPEDGDEEPPVTPYDPEPPPPPPPPPPSGGDDGLFTPVPTQPPEDDGVEVFLPDEKPTEKTLPPRKTPPTGPSQKPTDSEVVITEPDTGEGTTEPVDETPTVPVDETPSEPIEIEPEQPLPSYRYTPYVPAAFQYLLPDVARGFPGANLRPFTGGVSDSELDVGYGDVTAPELSLPPATYQPIPSFQVAQPEYVQIEGPSAPVVDPFATPIQPEFAPLPSYERATYSPQTQKMVDQILSEEEMANPFMNPYLRSGVFGGR